MIRYGDIQDQFGSAGANIPPSGAGGTPSLRDVLRVLLDVTGAPYADSTALTASLAKDRVDGQVVVKMDDYTKWTWKAADSTAADTTHIAPTDVGVGDGRWVREDAIEETTGAQGEMQRVTTTFNLAAIQALSTGVAFNVGSPLPANARVHSVEAVVTAITGGSISAMHLTMQGGSDAAGSLIADSTVTAGGTFATPGTNPYPSRGSQQLKATLTATGDTLNHATAGAVTFNVFFSIVP